MDYLFLPRSYYQTCASWPRTNFLFQQDGAPAHRARDTVAFLERETPHFIPPTLWPPNSQDLNPVDYSIWSVLQEKVYHSRITDLEVKLTFDIRRIKTRLIDEWAQLVQSIVDAAIGQWCCRLHACVRARVAHFEHKFWQCWADYVMELTAFLNQSYFSLLCDNSVIRCCLTNNKFKCHVTILNICV